MKWRYRLSEYLLKGAYLGLAGWLALGVTNLRDVGLVIGAAFMATSVPLLWSYWRGAFSKTKTESGGGTAWLAKFLLLVIDHPLIVHGGVLVGTAAGMLILRWSVWGILAATTLGSGLGGLVYLLLALKRSAVRRAVMAGTALVVTGAFAFFAGREWLAPAGPSFVVAVSLLASTAILYLLIFSGRSEENELDIGLVAILLSLALGSFDAPRTVRSLVILAPVGLYVVYCERVLRQLVVFKHSVRGMEHERKNNWAEALVEYRLALVRDPKSELASAGSWRVHRQIDVDQLSTDGELWRLIDPEACLGRAKLLLEKENTTNGSEACRLLDLVERLDPQRRWEILPLRVRADLQQKENDRASALARRVLEIKPDQLATIKPSALEGAFQTWCLLLREPALVSVGGELIGAGGHLIDFIMMIEEVLRRDSRHLLANEFKTFLYRNLREPDFDRYQMVAGSLDPPLLDFGFCRDVAKELAAEPSGALAAIELAKYAREGLPAERLRLGVWLAQKYQTIDVDESLRWHERVCEEAISRGPASLSPAERAAVDESARVLAKRSEESGDVAAAIGYWEIFASGTSAGAETRRHLVELYEQKQDHLGAIKHLEALRAYQLSRTEREYLQAHKNRIYQQVTADELRPRLSEVERFFDFRFTYERAARLFDEKASVDEVMHYLSLAELGGAKELSFVNFLLGRLHLREGRDREAAQCFEAVAAEDPKKIRDEEKKKVYFRACRLLGELFVERLNEPEKAITYLRTFQDHLDSGADTLFLLGKAYELAGQPKQARKWYDMVLVYSSHPRAAAAREALARLSG